MQSMHKMPPVVADVAQTVICVSVLWTAEPMRHRGSCLLRI